jgi:hypothetical protein
VWVLTIYLGGVVSNKYLDEFMLIDGTTANLVVERTTEALLRDGIDVTISVEAMDDLVAQMAAWVGTRMLRFHNETGLGAQHIHVVLEVALSA